MRTHTAVNRLGLGIRVSGFGFRVQDLGFRVWGLGSRRTHTAVESLARGRRALIEVGIKPNRRLAPPSDCYPTRVRERKHAISARPPVLRPPAARRFS